MSRNEESDPFERERQSMVARQIQMRGIKDPRVLEAMRTVPRHLFVPPAMRNRAYEDSPLPLSESQTISQPYMVAWMTDLLALKGDEVVLEVGTGSGYQAAILSVLAGRVYSIERIESLARSAAALLKELGYANVEVVVGDGSKGLPEHASYQGIIVTAGAPDVPQALVEQLDDGGRLVIPVGSTSMQMLTVVERRGNEVCSSREGSCIFVPLVGKHGWRNPRSA